MPKRRRPYQDKHHVLHHARDWLTRKPAEALRENEWLIPPLDRDVHEDLHRAVPAVPLLGYHALVRTANDFTPHPGDYLRSMDEFIKSVDRAIHHRLTKPLEAELGMLTMRAVELQKPFIKMGLKA